LAGQSRRFAQGQETAMNIELDNSLLSLAPDGMVALRDAPGTRVMCVSGSLWITEDRQGRDVILQAGDSFVLKRPGLTLIMALEPAALRLSERHETLAARVVRWVRRLLPVWAVRPVLE
jgi:hypothetical protein